VRENEVELLIFRDGVLTFVEHWTSTRAALEETEKYRLLLEQNVQMMP
jgi:hypothetical protein